MERVKMTLYPDRREVVVEHAGWSGMARVRVWRHGQLEQELIISAEVLQAIGAVALMNNFCHHQDFMKMGNITQFECNEITEPPKRTP